MNIHCIKQNLLYNYYRYNNNFYYKYYKFINDELNYKRYYKIIFTNNTLLYTIRYIKFRYELYYNYNLTNIIQTNNLLNIIKIFDKINKNNKYGNLNIDIFIKGYKLIINKNIISIQNPQFIKYIKPLTIEYLNMNHNDYYLSNNLNSNNLIGGNIKWELMPLPQHDKKQNKLKIKHKPYNKQKIIQMNNKFTYIISGNSGLNNKYLDELLKNSGFVESPINVNKVMLLFILCKEDLSGFDKRTYNIQCEVKNVLNEEKHRITDKWLLYVGLNQYFPDKCKKYLAETKRLDEINEIEPNKQLIARPIGLDMYAGKGIIRIKNTEELQKLKPKLLHINKDYIVSEYITNINLWYGLKYHLRMYWLVIPQQKDIKFYQTLCPFGKILTAAFKYKNDDFDNNGIHDTHAVSTLRNLFFPYDMDELTKEQCNKIFKRMQKCLKYVGELFNKIPVGPYSESKYAFEVFGCDFLIKNDLNVILMEINKNVGMQSVPEQNTSIEINRYNIFSKNYYKWIYDEAIMPLLKKYLQNNNYTIPNINYKEEKLTKRELPDRFLTISDLERRKNENSN